MTRRLPPLNALRAFEAAGRHLSVSRAAAELNVTPGAVSHQVRALETHLGVALFRRVDRKLFLTDAGQRCLPVLTEAFNRVVEAVEQIDKDETSGNIVVSVPPGFGAKWLIPRLERFRRRHTGIDVRVSATLDRVDFRKDEVDLAVRFGKDDYSGLLCERLLDDAVAPMCNPGLLDGSNPLSVPADLRHHTLIHDESQAILPDWQMWLHAARVEGVDTTRGPRFTYPEHAIQAALDGDGVVLARLTLARSDLQAGRLVMPFGVSLPIGPVYYVVMPPTHAKRPMVAAFHRWLIEEARAEESGKDPTPAASGGG